MSRIFGAVSTLPDINVAEMANSTRASLKGKFRCPVSIETINHDKFSLGWVGVDNAPIYESERLLLTLDGHIYNSNFNIEEAYLTKGFQGLLSLIDGEFALALYDKKLETLYLARDRIGIKPLYYSRQKDYLAFSSEPRSLTELPGITSTANRRFTALFAASHYRLIDNVPEESPYRDISQLPASHHLSFSVEGLKTERYWNLQQTEDLQLSENEIYEYYRELFFKSVSKRLKHSPQMAFTLSGGMDSSSVLASSVRLSGKKQHAYSTVYSDKTYDESDEIKSMLNDCVSEWHRVSVDNPDVFSLVEQMVKIHDEPVATATWLSHFLLCREVAEQKFRSLYGGLGGDELNAGEYEYFFFFFADLLASGDKERFEREVAFWVKYHDHPIFKKSRDVAEQTIKKVCDLQTPGRCLPDMKRMTRYFKTLNPDYYDLSSFHPHMDSPFTSYLKNRTYQDIFRETAPCCLRAQDRHGNAFGIEHFLPFFDVELVEFMYKLPATLHIKNGVTKSLLRPAMKGVLPEETRTRISKSGWNAPAHIWFSGADAEKLRDIISSQAFKERGVYRPEEVEKLLNEHIEIVEQNHAKENHMMFFWQLLNTELWLRSLD